MLNSLKIFVDWFVQTFNQNIISLLFTIHDFLTLISKQTKQTNSEKIHCNKKTHKNHEELQNMPLKLVVEVYRIQLNIILIL